MKTISPWHVGVAAEAYVAAMFARCGYDVSVQYGANQPEYDLIAVSGDKRERNAPYVSCVAKGDSRYA